MTIKIDYKHEVVDGEKRIVVTSVSAIKKPFLPRQYLSGRPNCYEDKYGYLRFELENTLTASLSPSSHYQPEHFWKVVKVARDCGKRLHKVNAAIKALEAEWNDGPFSIEI